MARIVKTARDRPKWCDPRMVATKPVDFRKAQQEQHPAG